MNFIAKLSYALYLVHFSLIAVAQKMFTNWGIEKNGTPMLLLSIIISIAVVFVLHISIEKPFMNMRDIFLKPAMELERQIHVAFINANILKIELAEFCDKFYVITINIFKQTNL